MATMEELLRNPPVLFEGGMGSMLIARGLPAGKPGELFTLERPEVVSEVHRRYVAAGARVLTTNTFNGNRARLGHAGLAEHLVECNRRAVELARGEAGDACAVAGCLGPTGAMLEPTGDLRREEAVDVFTEQAAILHEAGVDVFLVETMFDVNESLAAIEGCHRGGDRPIIVTMTFTDTPRGFYTIMGNVVTDALPQLVDAGAFAVGANCTLGSAAMVSLAGEIRKTVDVPVLIQPNAGQPESDLSGVPSYPETPDYFADHALCLADAGVEMIGGCCGTSPKFIERIRTALSHRARRRRCTP